MQVCNPTPVQTGDLALIIDLDERGTFRAHVENAYGDEVFAFSNEEEDDDTSGEIWLVEAGYMKNGRDTAGLLSYLQHMGLATNTARMGLETLPEGNEESLPIRRLRCCVCGEATTGRQFSGQDRGWGLGSCCLEFVKPREEDMEGTYGKEGVHYFAPKPPAPPSPQLPFKSRQ